MRKLIISLPVLSLLLLGNQAGFAQESIQDTVPKFQIQEKIFFGGTAAFNIGRYYDMIDLQPYVGYRITPQLYSGLGVSYSYMGYVSVADKSMPELEDNYLGANVFVGYYLRNRRFPFLNHFYIQGECRFLQAYFSNNTEKSESDLRFILPFMGIGYKVPTGKRMKLNCYAGVVLNNKQDIPYKNPIVSIGVEF